MAKIQEGWEIEIVRRFGAAAKKVRGKRTAAWLSDETARLGHRVSPTVISKLDSGHRGAVLQVSEMVVIAAALGVPPVQLLYSDIPDGEVETLPGQAQKTQDAIRWFTGEWPFTPGNAAEVDKETTRRLQRARERWNLNEEAAGLTIEIATWHRDAERLNTAVAEVDEPDESLMNELAVSTAVIGRLIDRLMEIRTRMRAITLELGAEPLHWDAQDG